MLCSGYLFLKNLPGSTKVDDLTKALSEMKVNSSNIEITSQVNSAYAEISFADFKDLTTAAEIIDKSKLGDKPFERDISKSGK